LEKVIIFLRKDEFYSLLGVSLDSVDKYGKSALYEAIVCKRFEAAKVLVQANAKVVAAQDDFCDYMFK